jgi:predicted small lipoprotein YifL
MRLTRFSQLAILVMLAAALAACGGEQEAAAPEAAPTEAAPATPPPAPAADQPAPVAQPASILIEIFAAGSAEAASGGRGMVTFQGKSHPLSVAGVSLPATAGVPKVEVVGQVQQLERLEDLAGVYSAAEGGASLGGGPKIAQLENPQGVRLKLLGKQLAPGVSLDLNGMQISLTP